MYLKIFTDNIDIDVILLFLSFSMKYVKNTRKLSIQSSFE